ncbi:MAG TPA: 50S ribosomal protein L35 [Chthonomonadales bacterium]|nr:50S ribosomal protein L35 [Chthonomonadales bacterium]
MPKLKTRKTAAKRFRVTAGGKLVRRCTGLNHLMRKKTLSRRRRLLKGDVLSKCDARRVSRMLGQGA